MGEQSSEEAVRGGARLHLTREERGKHKRSSENMGNGYERHPTRVDLGSKLEMKTTGYPKISYFWTASSKVGAITDGNAVVIMATGRSSDVLRSSE
jgi:hypothetical protein